MYPLDEILLLCLLAVLAGAETIVDIARFGEKKRELLRRFRPFGDGTPSHDHLGDILASLDAEAFQRCFVAWVGSLTDAAADVIAIVGKTVRRSYQKKGGTAPIHMVSAFAARQRLVLGQVKVADKSNEITAIPKLLEMMAIEGATVTIDAMGAAGQRFRLAKPVGMARGGCQREIAQKIIDKKADYVLALRATRAHCATMSNSSSPSRRPRNSKTPRSAETRPSTAIMGGSRPEPPPSSTTSTGSTNTNGRD